VPLGDLSFHMLYLAMRMLLTLNSADRVCLADTLPNLVEILDGLMRLTHITRGILCGRPWRDVVDSL